MEPPCNKDEQKVQLLTAEEQLESNSSDVNLRRPRACYPQKIWIISSGLICVLLLIIWISTKSGNSPPVGGTTESPVIETLPVTSEQPEVLQEVENQAVEHQAALDQDAEVLVQDEECHTGLYSAARKQMRAFEMLQESDIEPISTAEVTFQARLTPIQVNPDGSAVARILIREIPTQTVGGSSYMTFIAGKNSTSISVFTASANGSYTTCFSVLPECVNLTVRLYSYQYQAFQAVELQGIDQAENIYVQTVFQAHVCPPKNISVPPEEMCSHKDISMEPGSWIFERKDRKWFWISHKENCRVPDMAAGWATCRDKIFDIQFIGDDTAHWYSYYTQLFFQVFKTLDSFQHTQKFTYKATCEDVAKTQLNFETTTSKLTFVIMHCGGETFFKEGYADFQVKILDLFAKAHEVMRASPNLRFVFVLSAIRRKDTQTMPITYTELNLFSSAAVNTWIADHSQKYGISVFDDMYPRTMGQAYMEIIDEPLTNMLLYHICSVD